MGVVVGQMVVTNVVFQVAAFPRDEGSQTYHGMSYFAHHSIDNRSVRSVLRHCGMTRIVTLCGIDE